MVVRALAALPALLLLACAPARLDGAAPAATDGLPLSDLEVEALLDAGELPGHAVDIAATSDRLVVAVGRAVVELEGGRPPAVRCTLDAPILQIALGEAHAFAITREAPWPLSCPLAGGPPRPVVASPSPDPHEQARGLVAEGDELTWITVGSIGLRKVYRAVDGEVEEVSAFHGQGDPGLIHLALDGASVHWSDAATNTLHSAPRAGGESAWIRSPDVITTQIAADGESVFWASWASIHRKPVTGGEAEVEEIVAARPDTERIWALSIDGDWLVWGGLGPMGSFVRRAPKRAPGAVEEIWGDGDCWEGELARCAEATCWVCGRGQGAVYRAR